MRSRNGFGAKVCALLLGGTLGIGCLVTGCAVDGTAKAMDTRQESAIQESGVVGTAMSQEEIPATSATAMVTDHWSDTLSGNGFTLTADVDVPAPKSGAYSDFEVDWTGISQEMLDRFVQKVAPDEAFMIDDETWTKADIEEQIRLMEEMLAQDQQAGDQEMVQTDQQTIDKLRQELENAPEALEPKPWDGKLYGPDGEQAGGDATYCSVTSTAPDGSSKVLSVSAAPTADSVYQQYLTYIAADYTLEEDDIEFGGDGESDAQLEKRRELYAANTMDPEQAQVRVLAFLSEIGFDGLEATGVGKALWSPMVKRTDDMAKEDVEQPGPSSQALEVSFATQADGLACASPSAEDITSELPSSPVDPIHGSVLISEDGTILGVWLGGAGTIGAARGGAKPILSLADVSGQISESMGEIAAMVVDEEADPDQEQAQATAAPAPTFAYSVEKAALGCALVGDPQAPNGAVAVPAWVVRVHTDDPDAMYNTVELAVSAVDGQKILPTMMVIEA